ncbi:MAG: hypothetical protein M3A44_00765 [Gammaproteobacteria bacterium]
MAGSPKTAAPIGDKAALEVLAKAYQSVQEKQQLSLSPLSLPADARKKFVEMVFAEGGYNYSVTLHKMAASTLNASDQNTKDLAELLLMPHRGLSVAMEEVYSADELRDVRALEGKMK